jgi:ribosomal protein L7/L12
MILSSWNIGFAKIDFTKVLRSELGYSLQRAKTVTDAILDGHSVTIELRDDQVEEMASKLKGLGLRNASIEES